VRLVARFLTEHTGAPRAHIIVDARNEASLRVAAAVGAVPTEQWHDDDWPGGRTLIRHILPLSR
jgi:RimJ/RimL family protein N-acetyltransferase